MILWSRVLDQVYGNVGSKPLHAMKLLGDLGQSLSSLTYRVVLQINWKRE